MWEQLWETAIPDAWGGDARRTTSRPQSSINSQQRQGISSGGFTGGAVIDDDGDNAPGTGRARESCGAACARRSTRARFCKDVQTDGEHEGPAPRCREGVSHATCALHPEVAAAWSAENTTRVRQENDPRRCLRRTASAGLRTNQEKGGLVSWLDRMLLGR